MIEIFNRNLGSPEPEYYYEVCEFLTTFGLDEGKNKPLNTERVFKDNDLRKSRAEATLYYYDRLLGLKHSSYFLPFASPENFIDGENAAYSITLYLVEYYNSCRSNYYPVLGEEDQETIEGRELETDLMKDLW